MIILRIKPRATIPAGTPVLVSDVADVMCDARLSTQHLTVPMPREPGIWLVDAGSIMSVLYKQYPSEKIVVLGDAIGWLRRLPGRGPRAKGAEWIRLACCAVFARICAKPAPPIPRETAANARGARGAGERLFEGGCGIFLPKGGDIT